MPRLHQAVAALSVLAALSLAFPGRAPAGALGTPAQRFAGRPLATRQQVEAAIREIEADGKRQGVPLESKEMQDLYAFLFDRWYEVSLRLSIATCTTDMDRLFPKAHEELTAWENQVRTKTSLAADSKWDKRIRNAWRALVRDVRLEIEKVAARCPGTPEAQGRELYGKMNLWGATGSRLLNVDEESLAFFDPGNLKRLACRKECLKDCKYIRLLNPRPAKGEKNVSVKVIPQVSSTTDLQSGSVVATTIVVSGDGQRVGGTTTRAGDGKTLLWRPTAELKKGTTYTVTVRRESPRRGSDGGYDTQELLDIDDMPLEEDYVWSFTTEGEEEEDEPHSPTTELKWCGTVTVAWGSSSTPPPTEPRYPGAERCTRTTSREEHFTATLKTGAGSRPVVDAAGSLEWTEDTVCTARPDCRRTMHEQVKLVDRREQWGTTTRVDGSATVSGGSVGVRVKGDRAFLTVNVPEVRIQGTMTDYREGHLYCPTPPPRKESTRPFSWKFGGTGPATVETHFDTGSPDRFAGSETVWDKTYTWNLARKPASQCGGGK